MSDEIVECTREDIEYVERELVRFNGKQVPYLQERVFIDLNYKIEKSERIVAGIRAVLYCWNCLFIDILFVDEQYRKKGYGTALLRKVEQEALIHGCHLMHLDTFDFQAKEFYLKNGFEVFGELTDCPIGHTRYYMKKNLLK